MDALDIIAQNLTEAEALLSEGRELHYAHLKELARLLNRTDAPPSETYHALLERLNAQRGADSRETAENDIAKPSHAELDLHSRIALAREWASSADPIELPEYGTADGQSYTIAHFGNLYADSALAAFARAIGNASALPSEDYASACEEVSDGAADFCILPIESAHDGVMDRFEQMIDRYSLFIVMTCTVRLGEDEAIRYALLAASPCQLAGESGRSDRLAIQVSPEGEALWELLLAADLLGVQLLECRLSSRRDDRTAGYRLTFSANRKGRSELLAYLELGYSSYVLTGVYRQLDVWFDRSENK